MRMLTEVIEQALTARTVEPRDAAAAELARTYARSIDGHDPCEECGCEGCGDLAKLGPALLACLEALGLTPRARKAVKASDQPAANPLDQLAARRARADRAAPVDAAAT